MTTDICSQCALPATDDARFCSRCGSVLQQAAVAAVGAGLDAKPAAGTQFVAPESLAGGAAAFTSLPTEVKASSWNWGAFLLDCLWCFGQKAWAWGGVLLALHLAIFGLLVPGLMADLTSLHLTLANWTREFRALGAMYFLFRLLILLLCIPLAKRAHRIAWSSGRFETTEQFSATEQKWTRLGLYTQGVVLGVALLCFLSWLGGLDLRASFMEGWNQGEHSSTR